MAPEDPEPYEVMDMITAAFGYDRDNLKEMDRSGIDEEYFAELIK